MTMTNREVRKVLNAVSRKKYGKNYHYLTNKEAERVRGYIGRKLARTKT